MTVLFLLLENAENHYSRPRHCQLGLHNLLHNIGPGDADSTAVAWELTQLGPTTQNISTTK